MLNHLARRYLKAGIFVFGTIIVIGLVIGQSQSFHHCIQYAKYQKPYNDAFPVFTLFGFGHSIIRDRLVVACSIHFVDIHNGLVTAIATVVLSIVTYTLWSTTRELSVSGRDQLTLTYPPKLQILNIHIWNRGEGNAFNSGNALPRIQVGTAIEGTAIVLNIGRERAYIKSSDIIAIFLPDKIGMNYPGWEDPGGNKVRAFHHRRPDFPIIDKNVEFFAPGKGGRFQFFKTITAEDIGKTLYIIGHVNYEDTLGTSHAVYFVKKYDPDLGGFDPIDTSNGGEWLRY